jgi:hypothetical protein
MSQQSVIQEALELVVKGELTEAVAVDRIVAAIAAARPGQPSPWRSPSRPLTELEYERAESLANAVDLRLSAGS